MFVKSQRSTMPESSKEHSWQALDNFLVARKFKLLSLNPAKETPTSFAELGRIISGLTGDRKIILASKTLLENVLKFLVDNFPENIFLDLDFFVVSVVRQSLVYDKGSDCFFDLFNEKLGAVLNLFGRKSTIRFRYLHDFTYGFDWAKWVQKEPEIRRFIGPFSLAFLDYLLGRGQELLALIDLDNQKYHRIADESYRNPYAFCREPHEEIQLLKHLARRQWVPIAAWDGQAIAKWNEPFHQLREQMALALQLPQ